jgi:hypothetical protein
VKRLTISLIMRTTVLGSYVVSGGGGGGSGSGAATVPILEGVVPTFKCFSSLDPRFVYY